MVLADQAIGWHAAVVINGFFVLAYFFIVISVMLLAFGYFNLAGNDQLIFQRPVRKSVFHRIIRRASFWSFALAIMFGLCGFPCVVLLLQPVIQSQYQAVFATIAWALSGALSLAIRKKHHDAIWLSARYGLK